MISNFSKLQEDLKNQSIPITNEKLKNIFLTYQFYFITEDINHQINTENYFKIKEPKLMSIYYYKEADGNYFIIGFEKTILIIMETNISFISNLFNNNSNLIISFLPDTKCFFDKQINFQYNESELFFDCSSIDTYIQSEKEEKLIISILSCILQNLFQNSYYKLSQKNRINDYINMNEVKPKIFDENEYIKIEKYFSGTVFRTQLIYCIENEEMLLIKEPSNFTIDFQKLQKREKKIYQSLNHPLLAKFYGTTKNNDNLVIEYINGQTLYYIKNLNISYCDKIRIIYEIMIIISFFHKNKLILRDLKPDNIIIDHNKTAVFFDFDSVIDFDEESNTIDFSLYFSAPETQYGNSSNKSDIYSLGMIIYYIMIEKNPTKENIEKYNDFGQYSIIKEIFLNCIKEDPNERKNIMDIINTFFTICETEIQSDELLDINNIFIEFDYLKDDPRKELILGHLFHHSQNIKKYINKVIYYFTLLANKNDPEAKHNLGVIYYEGKYVEKNINKAIQYFKMAKNYAPSQFYLGFIYTEIDINEAIYYYTLSAEQNYLQAQYNLGLIYCHDEYINRDIEKAIHYFTLAADQNDPQSQYSLGEFFYKGIFTTRNIEKAIHYLSLAANQNNSNAQQLLGIIYYYGQYVQRDINKSIHYLTLAANQGHPEALFSLGIIYLTEDYVPRNTELFIHCFELAAEQNHIKAQINLGLIYYEGKYIKRDINKSIYYYSLAAKQNSAMAQYNIGFIYLEGKYIERDIEKSIDYMKQAANQNYVKAQYNLALIYYNNEYISRDINKAIYYFLLAAKQNYDDAQFYLGLIYFEKKYVPQDIEKAIYYFTLAANQNNSRAQHNLGCIYCSDKFGKKDIQKAINYLYLSANQGNPYAQYTLGYYYFEGKYTKIDLDKSIKYFTLASNQNFVHAQFFLGIFYLVGLNVQKDIKKALNLLHLASLNKDSAAMFEIGYLYQEGKYVEKNIDESISYYKKASTYNSKFAKNNLGIIYMNLQGQDNTKIAIGYFEEAINKYNDNLSMYNLAHYYIYEDNTKDRISKSIEYLIYLSNQKFSVANDLLCIALIKKYGFDLDNIKKKLKYELKQNNDFTHKIILKLKEEKWDKEEIFRKQYKIYESIDFIYNHLFKPVQSKSLDTQKQTQDFPALYNLTSDFYDGFLY